MKLGQLEELIKTAKKILLVSHINPDGDALGSTSAMYTAIYDRYKKKSDMLIIGHLPSSYKFLPHINEAKFGFDSSLVYDLVISLDVAAIDRLTDFRILFDKATVSVNIDHHKTNDGFGNINFVDAKSSSTGEVLFDIFKELKWNINLDMAIGLYTAILTDTGGFRYTNTSAKVFNIASELVSLGVNPNEIYKNCYELKSKNFLMFQSYCLTKAQFSSDNKIAYTTVYKKDLEKFNAEEDSTEGLVETLRSIETTDVSFLVKEIDSKASKISMRSKKVDVAKICGIFGGGGHTFAAGCTIKSNIEGSVKKILKAIEETQNG